MTGRFRACSLALALLAVAPALGIEIGAELDREVARVGERLVLTVQISGEAREVTPPRLPDFGPFRVFAGGSSQQVSWINGQMSASHSFTYYLLPEREGEFTLPPIEVEVDGRSYRSVELAVRVLAAAASTPSAPQTNLPPAGGREAPEYFVTMTASRDSVVVGEQITLTFAFYRSALSNFFESPEYTAPTTEGFWREDLPPAPRSSRVAYGRRYEVQEIRYALFATRSGQLSIGEAVLRIPADVFGSFFRRRAGRQDDEFLRTEPIAVTVLPLPRNPPANFEGTVGSELQLSAEVDRKELAVGEALSLRLSLEGDGYLAGAAAPQLPELEAFRAHDSGSAIDSRPIGDRLHGRLSVDKLLIPQREGDFTLPAIEYSYFDTAQRRYLTLRTEPIALHVTASDQVASTLFSGGSRSEIELLAQDIQHIRPIAAVAPWRGPLTRSAGYWLLLATPALLWLASGMLRTQRERVLADPARQRRQRARKLALARLGESGGDPARLDYALRAYVADRCQRETAGLTLPEIERWLAERGVAPELVARCLHGLEQCDALRYAGARAASASLAAELAAIVEALEASLGDA